LDGGAVTVSNCLSYFCISPISLLLCTPHLLLFCGSAQQAKPNTHPSLDAGAARLVNCGAISPSAEHAAPVAIPQKHTRAEARERILSLDGGVL
jgi:hypothetical protein